MFKDADRIQGRRGTKVDRIGWEFVRRKLTESRRQDAVQGDERMKVAGRVERRQGEPNS
jgi:hypothetical protein